MGNTIKTNKRNYWIELLRFIAISLILAHHFINNNPEVAGIWPKLTCGVLTFVFISGFFFGGQSGWRTKKFAITVLIWTVFGLIIYGILFCLKFPVENPINFFFGDFITGKYSSWWFIYTYLGFTLLQPFINKFIQKFDKWITLGIIILFCICSISFNNASPQSDKIFVFMTFNQLAYFTWCYAFGAWFSVHYKNRMEQNRSLIRSLVLLILCIICMLLLWYRDPIMSFLSSRHIETVYIWDVVDFLNAITLTLFFFSLPNLKLKITGSIFNFLGKISLSLYLTHPTAWMIVDRFGWMAPKAYSLGFYTLRFIVYYIIAIAFATIMYYIEKYSEVGLYKLFNKIKNKSQKDV